ncbi:hypothetical protein GJAV_G00225170 [Gymnothorax javanicus]|nr:hypothetical protein GJAV_G00225170 [Gymnothorax javanicus]
MGADDGPCPGVGGGGGRRAVFGVTLRREPVDTPPDPAEDQTDLGFVQYRTCKVRRIKAATLARLVSHLLDPGCQETDYTHIFLSMYRAFTSASTVIKLLFQSVEEAVNVDNGQFQTNSLSSLILTWLEKHGEDFREPPLYPSLRLLSAQLRRNLLFRRLAQRADALLKKFKHNEASSPDLASPQHQAGEEEEEESEDEGLWCKSIGDAAEFMDLPVADVAEELTRLDADLFQKVVPFQCLGCLWSQRDKNESLCPTVRATIAQFNAITNRVITSILSRTVQNHAPSSPRGPPPSPAQRARIIEKWITVAQECRRLKNFSSLKAILSALQSNAIYRLRKTWAAVCKDSMATFEQLCETFPDENCVLTSREILLEDGAHPPVDTSSPKTPKGCPISQPSLPEGVVPYLGTYLTVLTMLDTALPDTMEGGLINFEKRRREFEILSQIEQLQSSCSQYSLSPRPNVCSWLLGAKLLSDQESYELSRDLEPPVDSCPNSPVTWSQRLLTRKLASLLAVGEGSGRKTHLDQISVSSNGSSGSEMEDLSTTNSSPLSLKSLSGSCHNMETLSPGSFQNSGSPLSPAPQHKRSVSMLALPVYNRQVADSCIVRVSVEQPNSCNLYKSILLTSQDKTAQVIQRALEKHGLENYDCQDFTLSQVLSSDKELLIPDKANVFYAMSTTSNFDFILRHTGDGHRKPMGSTGSLGSLTLNNNGK